MQGNRYRGVVRLLFVDYLASSISWLVFFFVRKQEVYHLNLKTAWQQTQLKDFGVIFLLIPLFWISLLFFTGSYFDIYKKPRLRTLYTTFIVSLIGSVLLFFIFVINDINVEYNYFYRFIWKFTLVQFSILGFLRILILNHTKKELKKGKVKIPTIIVGSESKAVEIYKDLLVNKGSSGIDLVGFITVSNSPPNGLSNYLPHLGSIGDAPEIMSKYKVEDVYIAIESTEHHTLQDIILKLSEKDVSIKIDADIYDITSGMVRTSNIFMSPYLEVNPLLLPEWELLLKRIFDVVGSMICILILIPVYVFAAIRVKLSSQGSIIYKQTRIGKNCKPFEIYKFRSMREDAESRGPMLSSKNDMRITSWGKVMRKWRIDEIPQFYNILKGDMSFVGPRPEREFFRKQLSELQPTYNLLYKVKPGITSWGMVKFGYAENIDEMLQRMKYDLLYVRNASLLLDFKILLMTIIVILQGRGK